jgi:hypothetical protein
VKRYWLDSVSEAQSVVAILRNAPEMFAGYYITPLLALGVLAVAHRRRLRRPGWLSVMAMLAIAVLVSFWQVRGAMFSLPLAVIPLAVWVSDWRHRAAEHPGTGMTLGTLAVWLVSTALVWQFASMGVAAALPGSAHLGAGREASASQCYRTEDYVELAALPAGTVLAASNIGAPILRFTHHRTIAGPYHRNVPGLVFMLDIFMAAPDRAAEMALRQGIDYVAVCPGNPDSGMLAHWAPTGLMAALMNGEMPSWLTPVEVDPDSPLRIYRLARRH